MGRTAEIVARALVSRGKGLLQAGPAFKQVFTSKSNFDNLEADVFRRLGIASNTTEGLHCAINNGLTSAGQDKRRFKIVQQEHGDIDSSDSESDEDDLEVGDDVEDDASDVDDGDLSVVSFSVVSDVALAWLSNKVRFV